MLIGKGVALGLQGWKPKFTQVLKSTPLSQNTPLTHKRSSFCIKDSLSDQDCDFASFLGCRYLLYSGRVVACFFLEHEPITGNHQRLYSTIASQVASQQPLFCSFAQCGTPGHRHGAFAHTHRLTHPSPSHPSLYLRSLPHNSTGRWACSLGLFDGEIEAQVLRHDDDQPRRSLGSDRSEDSVDGSRWLGRCVPHGLIGLKHMCGRPGTHVISSEPSCASKAGKTTRSILWTLDHWTIDRIPPTMDGR